MKIPFVLNDILLLGVLIIICVSIYGFYILVFQTLNEDTSMTERTKMYFDQEEKQRYYDEIEMANLPYEIRTQLETLVAMTFSSGMDHFLRHKLSCPSTGEYRPELISKFNLEDIQMFRNTVQSVILLNQNVNWYTLVGERS